MHSQLHPVEKAGALDSFLRRFLHNPRKILRPYIKKGMTVLDLGCGPGFFTFEIAKMLDGSGKVIAADLQEGMLEKVRLKFHGYPYEKSIRLHKCTPLSMNLTGKVDFVLAFYSMHEVSGLERLIRELIPILKKDAMVYIAEQKFHVPAKSYQGIIEKMKNLGFEITETPRVFLSRAAVMRLKPNVKDHSILLP